MAVHGFRCLRLSITAMYWITWLFLEYITSLEGKINWTSFKILPAVRLFPRLMTCHCNPNNSIIYSLWYWQIVLIVLTSVSPCNWSLGRTLNPWPHVHTVDVLLYQPLCQWVSMISVSVEVILRDPKILGRMRICVYMAKAASLNYAFAHCSCRVALDSGNMFWQIAAWLGPCLTPRRIVLVSTCSWKE